LETKLLPMTPLVPGLLSMTTGCPIRVDSFSA
jgi:hypothetical protein